MAASKNIIPLDLVSPINAASEHMHRSLIKTNSLDLIGPKAIRMREGAVQEVA